ncbi:hypothetical protein BJX70DRAFT_375762 [Aspergillus crustosus]
MENKQGKRENNQRLAKACQRCRVRRIRCSGSDPCTACDRSSHECIYRTEPARRRRRTLSPAKLPHSNPVSSAETQAQNLEQLHLHTGLSVRNHENGALHYYGNPSLYHQVLPH